MYQGWFYGDFLKNILTATSKQN